MELYEKHVVLYGAKDLVPVAIVIDVSNTGKEPLLLVSWCYELPDILIKTVLHHLHGDKHVSRLD